MSKNISGAVDRDMLFKKSSDYIKRALESKEADDISMYWLLSSVALELLGKAALADRHPFLVVNPKGAESYEAIFVEAGTRATAEVRTITAKIAYEKLEEIVPGFNREIMSFCKDIAARRNAELHSGESPFESIRANDWEKRYWDACGTILDHVGSSTERWLDESGISSSPIAFGEAAICRGFAAVVRVDNARINYESKKGFDQEHFSDGSGFDLQSASRMLKEKYDEIWDCSCPACKSRGLAAGNQTEDSESERTRYSAPGLDELIRKNFIAEQFICPSCGLELSSGEEVYYAAKSGYHYEKYEKKMQ